MVRKLFLFFLLFCSLFPLQSQNNKLYDSIQSLERKQFLSAFLTIPYDIAVSNVNRYETLARKSINISHRLNDSASLGKSYQKLALSQHFSSKDEQSLTSTLKAIKIFEKLSEFEQVGGLYLEVGWRLKYRDLSKAIMYMNKGLAVLKKHFPNSLKFIGGYNNYGVLKLYKNQLDSAKFYHNKSLILAKATNDSISIPFAYTHMAQVYLKQQKFDIARKYLDSSFNIRQKRNDIYGITDTYLYYGDLFFEQRKFNKAINNFNLGYELSKKNNYFPLKKYSLQLLHKSYDSVKDYKNSLRFLQRYQQLQDSVLNAKTNAKIAELEIEYQTEKKEKEISNQQLVIKNRNLYAIIITFSLLIFIIVSIALFKKQQYKRKQLQRELHLKEALAKIQTQNRLQEQRLRISRDLHDNIGSQLSFIISSIDNLKYVTKEANNTLKEKLSSISSFTSETIFQLRNTIWAMNKSEITMEDLQTRILSFIEKAKLATETISFDFTTTSSSPVSFSTLNGITVFRIIQEAINNAMKYSNASKITIHISEEGDQMNFKITDNGVGFDKNEILLGNGLLNMEKRIQEINGDISIDSKLNQGTIVNFSINK